MFGLGKLQTMAIAVVVLSMIAGGIYWRGRSDGISSERYKSLQATINQLKERAETDAEIRDMDVSDLCVLLGGSMSDDGECE
jgi:hypothetical protein